MKVDYFSIPSWSIEMMLTFDDDDMRSVLNLVHKYLTTGERWHNKSNNTVNYVANKWIESIDRRVIYDITKEIEKTPMEKERTANDTLELGKKVFEDLKEEWQNKIKSNQ